MHDLYISDKFLLSVTRQELTVLTPRFDTGHTTYSLHPRPSFLRLPPSKQSNNITHIVHS